MRKKLKPKSAKHKNSVKSQRVCAKQKAKLKIKLIGIYIETLLNVNVARYKLQPTLTVRLASLMFLTLALINRYYYTAIHAII